MSEIEKMDVVSMNISEDKREKLKEFFPEIFTEGKKIDFDRLKLTLGESVDTGKERYGMNWPGKTDCFKIIQKPSIGTLIPDRDESVNFDNTENLFIEGDNLEVLKLLQKSYLGKIKMIYIDPPYNTGNDFIYPDDYGETLNTYLRYTGQIDNEGRKYSTNTETDGRFHSKWLNMMNPRLFLARNLLREDGVIFISIDDNEVNNLRLLMNEIFGEENFLGCISVVSNLKGRSDDKYYATAHNYLLIYCKGAFVSKGVPIPEEYWDDYPETDEEGKKYRSLGLRKRGSGARREDRPSMFFPVFVDKDSNKVSLTRSSVFSEEVLPKLSDGSDGRWRWGKETVNVRIEELIGKTVGTDKRWDIFQVDYAENDEGLKRIKPKTIWTGSEFSNEYGTLETKKIFGKRIFDNPKPTCLIEYCLEHATSNGDIVLDFFAGSGTTAHAILTLNNEGVEKRKFICVQLPEKCDEKSEAFKAGYKTIADIGKERIRRVIEKIKKEQEEKLDLDGNFEKQDLGFRVFKLQSSNFKLWNADVDKEKEAIEEQVSVFVDHVKHDRTQGDILYELLLKSGFPLTTGVEKITLSDKTVYSISGGAMLVCLEKDLTEDLMKAIAERGPSRVICMDEGFHGNDQLKTNALQIMKSKNVLSFRTV